MILLSKNKSHKELTLNIQGSWNNKHHLTSLKHYHTRYILKNKKQKYQTILWLLLHFIESYILMSCSTPFVWKTVIFIMIWMSIFFSQTPYNLTFHCLKLSDSIGELALAEEEKGLEGKSGAIPISSDLQIRIFQFIIFFNLGACH